MQPQHHHQHGDPLGTGSSLPYNPPWEPDAGYDWPEWHYGCLDCLQEPDVCMDVVFCSFCQMGRQFDAAEGRWDSLNPCVCVVTCLSWPLLTVAEMCVRYRVVQRYGIQEHAVFTLCLPVVCWHCSACQTYRELNERGVWPGGTMCVPRPSRMTDIPPSEYSVPMENGGGATSRSKRSGGSGRSAAGYGSV